MSDATSDDILLCLIAGVMFAIVPGGVAGGILFRRWLDERYAPRVPRATPALPEATPITRIAALEGLEQPRRRGNALPDARTDRGERVGGIPHLNEFGEVVNARAIQGDET